jgi:hypothetical protein
MNHYESARQERCSQTVSERDHGARKARPRLIEETAHAQSFSALNGNQAHVAPQVVAVAELGQKRFVAGRIAFESSDAILNRVAESKTDFESVTNIRCGSIEGHRELSGLDSLQDSEQSAQGFPAMADGSDGSPFAPDYDVTELA